MSSGEFIVLGDGLVSVDGHMVKGSRMHRHDPILIDVEEQERARRSIVVVQPAREGLKWCCCPYHYDALRDAVRRGLIGLDMNDAAEGWMPQTSFSKDDRKFDKLASWCNVCEAYRKRRQRQQAAAEMGDTVRAYERTTS